MNKELASQLLIIIKQWEEDAEYNCKLATKYRQQNDFDYAETLGAIASVTANHANRLKNLLKD